VRRCRDHRGAAHSDEEQQRCLDDVEEGVRPLEDDDGQPDGDEGEQGEDDLALRRPHQRALAALATAKHEWIALYLIAIALLLTATFTIGAAIFAICCFIAALRTKLPGSRVALLTISILLLFLIAGNGQGALFRTCLLAALAAALAFASRLGAAGTGTVARIVLVAEGVKLLAEDVQVESAAKLVLSFASYGLAMLTVARCVRRHTSARPQSLGMPPADTFGCRPKDDTV